MNLILFEIIMCLYNKENKPKFHLKEKPRGNYQEFLWKKNN